MKRKNSIGCLVYGVFGLFILALLSISIAGQFVSNQYKVTVSDKLVKHSKEHSKYLIFTELKNGEIRVFQDTDSLIRGKFNSSDVYGEIKVGHKYNFKVYGYRIPALSMYENIVEAKEIK